MGRWDEAGLELELPVDGHVVPAVDVFVGWDEQGLARALACDEPTGVGEGSNSATCQRWPLGITAAGMADRRPARRRSMRRCRSASWLSARRRSLERRGSAG